MIDLKFSKSKIILLVILSLASGCKTIWPPVYDNVFLIGNTSIQDFSKDNLVFKVECDGDKTQITFYKPENLAKRNLSNYQSGTEIHYDDKHYLTLTDKQNCTFELKIFKRKRSFKGNNNSVNSNNQSQTP